MVGRSSGRGSGLVCCSVTVLRSPAGALAVPGSGAEAIDSESWAGSPLAVATVNGRTAGPVATA